MTTKGKNMLVEGRHKKMCQVGIGFAIFERKVCSCRYVVSTGKIFRLKWECGNSGHVKSISKGQPS